MKKSELMVKVFLILIIAFIYAACGGYNSGVLHEKYIFDEKHWGEWIRMDTGETWYFASNYMMVNNSYYASLKEDMVIEEQSQNVIKVTEKKGTSNQKDYFLYASRLRNSSFGASAVQEGSRSVFARVVNVPKGTTAVVEAVKNRVDKQTVEIGEDGDLTAENIIAGDDYLVTIDGYEFEVTPNTDGDNVGTLTLTSGVNMKTSIVPQSSWSTPVDLMRLYVGENYDLIIKFTNIGEDKPENICYALDYTLILPIDNSLKITKNDDTSSSSDMTKGTLQTIMPGKTREVKITVMCVGPISEDFEIKDIGITTEDYYGKTWDDSVSLKVNKEKVTFHIRSNNEINGVVIVPNSKTYHFTTSGYNGVYSKDVTVPKYSSKDYLIVFSGASADTEAKYTFTVDDIPPITDFSYRISDIKDDYKKSNTESNAAIVTDYQKEGVKAYLMMNMANYYKVKF